MTRIATRVRCLALLVGIGLATACAPKQTALVLGGQAADVARAEEAQADARLLAGCYACLVEARARYAALRAGPAGESARVKYFEAALLVTLREKEIALPFETSLALAEAAATDLPATVPAERLLDIVRAIPGDAQGWGRPRLADSRREHIGFIARSAVELTWVRTAPIRPVVATYLVLALGCAEFTGPLRTNASPVAEPPGEAAPPLLAYRGAACAGVRSESRLRTILDADPTFVEVALFLARAELNRLGTGGDWSAIEGYTDRLLAAFPQSPAVTYLAGRGRELMGDCDAALPSYARTLALEPRHDDGWLSRTTCETALGQVGAAIESATQLIALGPAGPMRDGFYWRAYNYRQASDLARARADIDSARKLGSSVDILTLAGQIEYDQRSTEESKRDLQRARQLSTRACVAAWYLGLIALDTQQWSAAGDAFELAMYCFREAASDARSELNRLDSATDLDPAFAAARRTGVAEALAEAEQQERWAAMNAAKGFSTAGQTDKIDRLVAVAALDPKLTEDIQILRAYLAARAPADRTGPR